MKTLKILCLFSSILATSGAVLAVPPATQAPEVMVESFGEPNVANIPGVEASRNYQELTLRKLRVRALDTTFDNGGDVEVLRVPFAVNLRYVRERKMPSITLGHKKFNISGVKLSNGTLIYTGTLTLKMRQGIIIKAQILDFKDSQDVEQAARIIGDIDADELKDVVKVGLEERFRTDLTMAAEVRDHVVDGMNVKNPDFGYAVP